MVYITLYVTQVIENLCIFGIWDGGDRVKLETFYYYKPHLFLKDLRILKLSVPI